MDSPFDNWHSDKQMLGLTMHYEKLFAALKEKPITYLEVGIAHGESLQWAEKFFAPNATLVGIDIYKPDMAPEKAHIYLINQSDTEGLIAMAKKEGPFDIIIDDASHVRSLTENTFNALFQFVKPDGFYIIEDWGAGYLPNNAHCKGMEALVTELVWKYGGSIHNARCNYAVIDARRGYGGYMEIQK